MEYEYLPRLSAYLHQDWDLDYADWDGAIRELCRTSEATVRRGLIRELEALLNLSDDDEIERELSQVGVDFRESAIGLSYRDWVMRVKGMLEETT